jgi:hypothetical protein
MARVITFSRQFPKYHPKAGQPTYFKEKLLHSLLSMDVINLYSPFVTDVELNLKHFCEGTKNHTIRAGNRWKVGDKFSPREWSEKPYNSKMTTIAPDIEIKKIFDFEITNNEIYINGQSSSFTNLDIAINDGLDYKDLLQWFQFPKPFKGQIICWNENINYH